ncbi:hypothetical protein [Limimaricola cinnabarinus]|uniref:Uncharacterized protein n=1 Tax=Limimaricola cinnabarinus LL-001 TaxID=1337093 RepID=U2Z5Q7_9RHOB|nr:hypothetical protein [Limimaricola cinnabarinus]GAD56750.1 hypothetical protein MBELCI_2802 [Limimaricola cinnabarinus LL-001]
MLGSEFCFPNDLLRTLCAEFDSVLFTRAKDLAEIDRLKPERGDVPLLIVDEAYIETQADMLAAAQARARTCWSWPMAATRLITNCCDRV